MQRLTLGALDAADTRLRMASSGLALRIPPVTVRVRSRIPFFADQLRHLYRDHEVIHPQSFADIDIRMLATRSWHRWGAPTVQLVVDGTTPFDAFPLVHALPMFEWGLNWIFAHRMHSHLLWDPLESTCRHASLSIL